MRFPCKWEKCRKDSERKNDAGFRPGSQGHVLSFFWGKEPNTTVSLFEKTQTHLLEVGL